MSCRIGFGKNINAPFEPAPTTYRLPAGLADLFICSPQNDLLFSRLTCSRYAAGVSTSPDVLARPAAIATGFVL